MKTLLTILFLLIFLPTAFAYDNLIGNLGSSKKFENVLVEKVLSADTIELENGKKIKLIGLKAPEPPPRRKIEYDKNGLPIDEPVLSENTFEEKAFAYASHLLLGKNVRLEFDESRVTEDLTVTLAYVFLLTDGTFANTEILRYGFADLRIEPPNFKYEEELRAAYSEARREKRGIHNN